MYEAMKLHGGGGSSDRRAPPRDFRALLRGCSCSTAWSGAYYSYSEMGFSQERTARRKNALECISSFDKGHQCSQAESGLIAFYVLPLQIESAKKAKD